MPPRWVSVTVRLRFKTQIHGRVRRSSWKLSSLPPLYFHAEAASVEASIISQCYPRKIGSNYVAKDKVKRHPSGMYERFPTGNVIARTKQINRCRAWSNTDLADDKVAIRVGAGTYMRLFSHELYRNARNFCRRPLPDPSTNTSRQDGYMARTENFMLWGAIARRQL